MRFFLDQDVSVAVRSMLRRHGHEAWSASEARLSLARDNDLAVYAHDRRAVLVSHDVEFARSHARNSFGRHVVLHCMQREAAEVLEKHLAEVMRIIRHRDNVVIGVGVTSVKMPPTRWE